MTVRSIHFTTTAPTDTQEVEEVYADNLPKGGGTIDAGSITNAMLAGGITKDKLAAGVIPTVPGAATTATAGTVKKAAAVTALADSATLVQVVAAFNDLLAKGKSAGFLS